MLTILFFKHAYFLMAHFYNQHCIRHPPVIIVSLSLALSLSLSLFLSAILPSHPLFHFDIKNDLILCLDIN
jgi:hypothetical protein